MRHYQLIQEDMKTFLDFLSEEHATGYYGTDDNMPDAFNTWLEQLDGSEYIDFADAYAKEVFNKAQYEEAKKHNPLV